MTIQVQFKILRQLPPDPPVWQIFNVEISAGSTILDGLNAIKWEQDGSLSFRKNCRNTICGSCAMQINGRAALACKESIGSELNRLAQIQASVSSPEKTEEIQPQLASTASPDSLPQPPVITIAPMGNFAVIKDLVVEMQPFWQQVAAVQPHLQTPVSAPPEREFLQSPRDRSRLDDVQNCILCGACYSACNALETNPKFLGPHALAKAYRWIADSRDQATPERLQAVNNAESGVWGCTRCFNCNHVCPVGVQPLDRITEVKQAVLAQSDDQASRAVRHRKVLVELVKAGGWIDERQFGLKVVGNSFRDWGGIASLGPLGLRLLRSGKFPWHFQPSLGAETVRNLISAVQAAEVEANSNLPSD